MKTNVRDVSIATHKTNKSDGTYNRTTEIIMRYITDHPGCFMADIAAGTGLRINQVSGRCHELKKHSRIAEGETFEVSPGHYATTLYVLSTKSCVENNDSRFDPVIIGRLADGQCIFS